MFKHVSAVFAAFVLLPIISLADSVLNGSEDLQNGLQALDFDRSGSIELSDVDAFARSNGLRRDELRAEFEGMDTNRDGKLDSQEMYDLLGLSHTSTRSPFIPAITEQNQGTKESFDLPEGAAILENHARQQAGRILAEIFSNSVTKAVVGKSVKSRRADSLEATAKALRGKATQIKSSSTDSTAAIATEAVDSVIRSISSDIRLLETEAQKKE